MRKTALWLAATLLFANSLVYAQDVKCETDAESAQSLQIGDCWKTAHTQLAMNECAGSDYAKADGEMNRAYKAVLTEYRRNAKAVLAIRKAQRTWVAFRDAQVKSIYPDDDPRKIQFEYGTMFSMCEAMQFTKLTLQRTRQLRELLDGNGICGHTPSQEPVVIPHSGR